MFRTEKIPVHVQSVQFTGKDDKKALKMALYITPLTHALAKELHKRVAGQLFYKDGREYVPVQEFPQVPLSIGEIPAQNLHFYPHNTDGADEAGVMVPGARISGLMAKKLFTDNPDFSLIFNATIPLDSHTIDLCRKYYQQKTFLTLEQAEQAFDFEDVEQECKVCGKPATLQIDGENQYVCDEHRQDGDTIVRKLR